MAYRTEGSAVIGIPDPPAQLLLDGNTTFEQLEAQALATLEGMQLAN